MINLIVKNLPLRKRLRERDRGREWRGEGVRNGWKRQSNTYVIHFMKETGEITTFRLSKKVKNDLKKIKKHGLTWDYLFEYMVECYYFRKEQIKKKHK